MSDECVQVEIQRLTALVQSLRDECQVLKIEISELNRLLAAANEKIKA